MARLSLALAFLVGLLGASFPTAPTALAQCSFAPGSVVELAGTPHLFIADSNGVLHWGGDTRGLAGRPIDWNNRCSLELGPLRAARRGDPWLSAGLPKIGEPIYQAKWEDTEAAPTLLHILSIADVELFGITEANYGNFILDRSVWEQRYGFQVGDLKVGPLASAESYAWSPTDRDSYAQLLTGLMAAESEALSQSTRAGIDAATTLRILGACEQQGLEQFDRARIASASLSATQDCIGRSSPVADAGAPSPPTGLRGGRGSTGGLVLNWVDTSNNEDGFRIDRDDHPLVALAANETTYTDFTWDLRLRQCYRIVAFNRTGEAWGDKLCPGSEPPTSPAELRLTPVGGGGGLRLDWVDTSGNADGFRILRGNETIGTVGFAAMSFVDTGWNPNVPTCYRVAAYNAAGQAISRQACTGT